MQSDLSRPLYTCFHRMCIIANGLGSLQKLAQAEQRCSQLRNRQLHRGAIWALRGNRKSQRPCVPPLAFPNRSFCCTLFSVVFKPCPKCSLAVCRFPAAAPHVDGSAHLSLERKNAGHFSDHVVCRVDVGSFRFDVLTLKTTPPGKEGMIGHTSQVFLCWSALQRGVLL